MAIFAGEPLSVTLRRISEGLKAPKDSGEYKYARYAMTRIIMPPSASFACSLLLLLFAFLAAAIPPPPQEKTFEVTVVETENPKNEIKPEEEKVEQPPPEDVVSDRPDLAPGPVNSILTPGPATEYSSGDNPNDTKPGVGGDLDVPMVPYAAVMTKSPVIIKGLYGNRTKGGREAAGRAFGGRGGIGFDATEGAVLRALRWLKKNQEANGSWKTTSGGGPATTQGTPAMTGLALLCYLAHGETPASEEFGNTVEKAIRWLVDNQTADGRFNEMDGNQYSLPIGAYALAEAYGMTKVPTLQLAAEKAMEVIIQGQHADGLWNYKCGPENRDDTTYSSWCAQALKAGSMAGLSNKGLKDAIKKAIPGFKKNQDGGSGMFGYTGADGGYGGHLTGAGTLCLQLMGASRDGETKAGIKWLDQEKCEWGEKAIGERPIYYWYYITQAKFHSGGETWNGWNKQFSFEIVKNQDVMKKAVDDGKGNMVDIGWWRAAKQSEPYGLVYNTTLCCLMLEVYYRYLPTFQTPKEEVAVVQAQPVQPAKDDKDKQPAVKIDIKME
jgi:hypothetical protein